MGLVNSQRKSIGRAMRLAQLSAGIAGSYLAYQLQRPLFDERESSKRRQALHRKHPLELFEEVAWDTYCQVARLGEHIGEIVVTCGLVVEQRTHHQITGEPMKFLTLADWTGMVETELFAQTYKA
jgi:DNA polymerase III alpha subunit